MPGRLPAPGLDCAALRVINSGLIQVTSTSFGSSGPKSTWPGSDRIGVSAGGQACLSGDLDRLPLRSCVTQAHAHAAAHFGGPAGFAYWGF